MKKNDVLADCRKCVYFYEYDNKVGGLGYCLRWRKPIRYYVGKCRGFRKKTEEKLHTLEEYGLVIKSGN